MSSQYKCIGEIRGILICNSFVVLILQPSCFCPRQSALGPSGAKMRRSRFCVAYFEEPVMSVFETGLKSKTWLWSQQAVVEKNWDASHVVCLPQCDQTADWGRFSSTAMIAVHAITCMRIAHVPRATNTGSVASCLCALLINVLPRRH